MASPVPTPAPSSEATALPAGAVAALSLGAFGSGLSLRLTDALLPRLAADFSVSVGEAARVITAFSVAYGLAQLFFGPVGDRFGKYRVVACGAAASALTATLCGLAPGFDTLVLARLLAGGTAAALIPLSMAWIGDVVPYEKRQPVLARFLIGQILGIAAGVWLGGVAADHADWRPPFLGIGILFVAIAAVLFAIDRRLPPSARATRRADGHALARMAREFGSVLALPWARIVIASVFLEGAFLYGAFAFIATHLHLRFGIALSTAGSAVMAFGLGGLAFAIGAAAFLRRLGEAGLTAAGAALMCAALGAIAFAPAWWWAAPACAVCGLGFYMMHNTLQTNATQMAPERRGAAVSAFASCFFLGQAAGVAAAGTLVSRFGTRWTIAAGAVGVLAVGSGFSAMRARRRPVGAFAA